MGNRGRNDSSSESDDWEDESWVVDCPCGVNFDDGEEMVECDECRVWVHTACCHVPKLLPSYVCDKCKYKKKQQEEESEVAQLLADLPSKPVSFGEKSVQRAELFTPFRVPSNLPTETKAHVTGIPGGDPSFFVGAPKIFSRQLWAYSGYVPKRFYVEYNQLGDPRDDTEELFRDLPNVVVPPAIDERLKRLARLHENVRENTGNCQGSLKTCSKAPTPSLGEAREVALEELGSADTLVPEVTTMGKQANSNYVRKVDMKAEGRVEGKVYVKAEREIEGKSKHRHRSKPKDEKLHYHAKRAREDVGFKDNVTKKKIRVRGDAVKSDDTLETLTRLEVLPDWGYAHAVSHTSPKNPKAMKKLAVQEFMHGVIRFCSRCRGSAPVPLSCGRTFYFTDWTCQKCGSLEGGTKSSGSSLRSGILKQEHGTVIDNVWTCSDEGVVDRKPGDESDAAVKTPRYREDTRQIWSAVDWPSGSVHGSESDGKDRTDLKGLDPDGRGTSHKDRALESGGSVNFEELESPRKRVKPVDQEKEVGETLEDVRDNSGHRASRSHSLPVEAREVVTSKVGLVRACSESKFAASDDSKSAADPQVEKKEVKVLVTSTSDLRGQGSARTSGCLPASVREKFSQQQQRAISISVGALQHSTSGQSPRQMSTYAGQKVVSPSSTGVLSGFTSLKVSHGEESGPSQIHLVGHVEGLTQIPKQHGRTPNSGLEGIQISQEGSQDVSVQLQRSLSAQGVESEPIHLSKCQLGEAKDQIRTDGQSPVRSSSLLVLGTTCSIGAQEPKVILPICQQARQSNGVGTYSRRSSLQTGVASASHHSDKTAANMRTITSSKSDFKAVGGQMRSPLSSGTSSSPTSPLVSTPSSKGQPHSSKAPGSPPPQKSLSGLTTPKSSSTAPQGLSKVSTTGTTSRQQGGTQHTSKSVTIASSTPLSSKAVNMARQSSKSSVLLSKSNDTGTKSSSVGTPSRGGNHGGPSSGGPAKDNVKSIGHSTSKVSASSKTVTHPTITKLPSSLKHSHGATKAASISGENKQHSGSSKPSTQVSTKPAAAQHNKVVSNHKEEKSSIPPATPAPKAVSTMPPPAKRSPPIVLTSPATTTLKDEELALLLHQELNSSPRVPRVPRVRQAGASLQLTSVSHASLSSAKGSTGSASGAGGSHKISVEHHPALRRRTKEDRLNNKDGDRNTGKTPTEEAMKAGLRRGDDGKSDDGRSVSESVAVDISLADSKESASIWTSQGAADGNSRHHLLGRGNLSIIVPGADDAPDNEKTSPADGSNTLSGLIEEVLNTKGLQISYEDVCEAILPHWSKLRKLNGERYHYSNHRQAVLESLRSRPAWAHLVDRTKGLQTYVARKRRRNEFTALSDSESDPAPSGVEHPVSDGLGSAKSSKRSKITEGEKGDGGSSSLLKCSADVSKGKRTVRRRRRLAMDDRTDGEDEPIARVEKDAGTAKAPPAKGASQEEEPDSVTSPSSEEAVSNYSEEDEEMVVHRGMRNRRRRGVESTGSEDDME